MTHRPSSSPIPPYCGRMTRSGVAPSLLGKLAVTSLLVWLSAGGSACLAADANASALETRLSAAVEYLASDALEGRGVGTDGLEKAAAFVAEEFAKLQLKTDLFAGAPFQNFTVTTDAEMGPKERNSLVLLGPAEEGKPPRRVEFKLGTDFNPLSLGGTGKVQEAPLVFAGYGITAKDHDYDDYAGLDVKDKVVLVLRKEPQQSNPHSLFNGTQSSQYAFFSRKVANAFEHGAAAVILVNDAQELKRTAENGWKSLQQQVDKLVQLCLEFAELKDPTPEQVAKHRDEGAKLARQIQQLREQADMGVDKVLPFNGAGTGAAKRSMPVFFCTRAAIDEVVKAALKSDLATLEQQIDEGPTPKSAPLDGWHATCEAEVIRKQADVRNVVAVLDGEGPLAEETVVVGAHYDHLGNGGAGSLAPWTTAVHNGADDNASGTAALLEVARHMAQLDVKPRRRVVFIAFTGEERGLLGSAHYVKQPLFPLEHTVAMVNMDMVGRMQDNKLIVHGTGTARQFDGLVDELNKKHDFKITKKPGGFGPSDHSSFYSQKIPVLHLFTGTHKDYHRPSDDSDKINVAGMSRVTTFVSEIVAALATAPERPEYLQTKRPAIAGGGGDRPYLGTIPDFSQETEGYALMGVSPKGPAERAGLKAGDVIIRFGESKIGGLEDIDSALRKHKAGEKVKVTVQRGDETVTLTVTLDPPR